MTIDNWTMDAGEATSNPAADVNGVEQTRRVPRSRVSEVAALQLQDVALSERRGKVIVRAGGIQMRIQALGESAGVSKQGFAVTPHVLRHTFATRFLREAKGRPFDWAQDRPGSGGGADGPREHANVSTTAIYP